ncbi:MAG: hypothetical protein JW838_08925 [Spirochaetes bacterium]|nr:hypothetical protein [Spirochaetota bacterium]
MKKILVISFLLVLAGGLNQRAMAWILIDARSPQVSGVPQGDVDAVVQSTLKKVRAGRD